MMRKIVIHADAARLAAQLHAAAHAAKARERYERRFGRDPGVMSRPDRGQGVHPIEFADEVPSEPAHRPPLPRHLERPLAIRGAALPAPGRAEGLDRRPDPLSQDALQRGVPAVDKDPSGLRDDSYKMMELSFDRSKIDEDVSMIELQIVENRGPSPVVHQFRALVEERRVVLVRLDNEELRAAR